MTTKKIILEIELESGCSEAAIHERAKEITRDVKDYFLDATWWKTIRTSWADDESYPCQITVTDITPTE